MVGLPGVGPTIDLAPAQGIPPLTLCQLGLALAFFMTLMDKYSKY